MGSTANTYELLFAWVGQEVHHVDAGGEDLGVMGEMTDGAFIPSKLLLESDATWHQACERFVEETRTGRRYTFLGGRIVVTVDERQRGNVTWDIERPTCPSCGEIQCCFMCDGSKGADEVVEEEEEDVMNRLLNNGALDGIETLIHCLVITGAVKSSEDPLVNAALEMALQSVSIQ
jgi:hypothetical protein